MISLSSSRSNAFDDWDSDSSSSQCQPLSPIRRSPHKARHHQYKTKSVEDKTFHEVNANRQFQIFRRCHVLINEIIDRCLLFQYEIEIENLRRSMHELQLKLNEAEHSLKKRHTEKKSPFDRQTKAAESDERIRKQQEEKDQQMKNIITR